MDDNTAAVCIFALLFIGLPLSMAAVCVIVSRWSD